MRLFEIASPSFYLCTAVKQTVREIVRAEASAFPLGAILEGRLEHRRPVDKLARDKSVYLHTTPCAEANFVYLVQPLGQIDRHHKAWLTMLSQVPPDQEGAVDQFAIAYWSGQERPEARNEPWEYRTTEVKILKRITDQNG